MQINILLKWMWISHRALFQFMVYDPLTDRLFGLLSQQIYIVGHTRLRRTRTEENVVVVSTSVNNEPILTT